MQKLKLIIVALGMFVIMAFLVFEGFRVIENNKKFAQGTKVVEAYNTTNEYSEGRILRFIPTGNYSTKLGYTPDNGPSIYLGDLPISKEELEAIERGERIQREVALSDPTLARPVGKVQQPWFEFGAALLCLIATITGIRSRWKKVNNNK
ncbi:hypothetical protein [Volucribacter amazonae]|uniref:Uncharacterized protein n=1 Tax=Volucribacter amazonae TaxID=256731 RepID=A0A9X4PAT7_9PAST|nr:hypothetical protein [Volucribacter amazonae]MDG6895653.1 hypothetical protein [Volucribacter amazonae]